MTLASLFRSVVPVRADGNCFYRAYLLGILKSSSESVGAISRLRVQFQILATMCKAEGYDAFAVDEFHELLDEQMQLLETNPLDLFSIFQDPSVDGYMMAFLRCACGAALKKWSDDFSPFLPVEYSSIEDFCRKEVDPMYRDCDQLQIVALTRVMEIPVSVFYLDRSEGVECVEHVLGEDYMSPDPLIPKKVNLIYRPGHYDLLY